MPSLGKDLATIREHLGFTLQDIQHSTKIPVQTLQSIDNGSIFDGESEIKTYVRSFVRSYAKALKIDNDVIVKALDQKENGNYNNLLLQEFPELSREISPPKIEEEKKKEAKTDDDSDTDDEAAKKTVAKPDKKSKKKPSKVSASKTGIRPDKSSKKSKNADKTTASKVDWADVGMRMKKEKKKTPVWLITIIILVILTAVIAFFLYEGEYFESNPTSQEVPEETANETNDLSLEISSFSPDDDAGTESFAALDDTLFITVYAAFDRLNPVRVWSDLKPRNDPYWIEQGSAMNFEFENTIRIIAPPDRMLLFMNGHRIDDFQNEFFNEDENAVELNRNIFSSESDWASQTELDLPDNVPAPDAITNRPNF